MKKYIFSGICFSTRLMHAGRQAGKIEQVRADLCSCRAG